MHPIVSILIPAYNAEAWIGQTLRTAISQTWPYKEIIVVDDGSTDGTLTEARRFESQLVRVVSNKNQGAAATRNAAYALSKGDYIQWLDADDLLSVRKVELQMLALEGASTRTVASSAWGQFLYCFDRAHFVPSQLWEDLSATEWMIRKLQNNLFMQTATWLVHRELAEAAGPWNTTMLSDDDGEYFSRVLLQCDGIKFVSDAKVYYRASGFSLSHIGKSNRKLGAQWESMKLQIERLRSLDDGPRSRQACVQYMQNWQAFFYPDRPDLIRQMQYLAHELGGQLSLPELSWKYSWMERTLGRNVASKAQFALPGIKMAFMRKFDKALFQLRSPEELP